MKLVKVKSVSGKIRVETGLHIGAGNDALEIGGMDNAIIKNPADGSPYIPGSSLKGKMRSLLEWKLGKVAQNNGNPCNCGDPECIVCRVYGAGITKEEPEKTKTRGPTRIIVRDAHLSQEYLDNYYGNPHKIIEEKNENWINRITAKATPRSLERVIPGVTFDFCIDYKVYNIEDDNGKKDEEYFDEGILEALRLLEKDYLGGGGSRGNGRISFIELKDENGTPITLYQNGEKQ